MLQTVTSSEFQDFDTIDWERLLRLVHLILPNHFGPVFSHNVGTYSAAGEPVQVREIQGLPPELFGANIVAQAVSAHDVAAAEGRLQKTGGSCQTTYAFHSHQPALMIGDVCESGRVWIGHGDGFVISWQYGNEAGVPAETPCGTLRVTITMGDQSALAVFLKSLVDNERTAVVRRFMDEVGAYPVEHRKALLDEVTWFTQCQLEDLAHEASPPATPSVDVNWRSRSTFQMCL